MPEYIYSGPLSGLTLRGAEGRRIDVALTPGATVDLPADNLAVAALVHRGHLTEVSPPSPEPPVKPEPPIKAPGKSEKESD